MNVLQNSKPRVLAAQTMLETALAWHGQGRLQEAEKLYRQILAFDPGNADCLHLLGMIAFQSGDCETAVTLIRRAIEHNPNAASYRSNLGNVLQSQGYARDAASCYLQALKIRPDLAEVHVNLGNIFLDAENFDSAITSYEHALELNPAIAGAHKSLGNAYRKQQRTEAALAAYDRALALDPNYVDAMTELSSALGEKGDLDGSLQYLQRILEIEPDHPTARFRLALNFLLRGEFAAGWDWYEGRWKSTDHATPMRDYSQPPWRGEPVIEGRLLLWPEQGVGDEIMFAGLIGDVVRTGSRCVLECDARLRPLFARSFPGIEVIGDRHAAADSKRQIAAQLPIASLPSLLRRDRASFAATVSPYLKVDQAKRDELRSRYFDGRRLIGVAWHSNNEKTGRQRSMDLSQLTPLLNCPGIRWVSLQYGEHDDLKKQAALAQAPILIDANVDQMASLDDFAAQVAAMDHVITIDNTTAHLAGALGIPVWVMVPFAPDWRWTIEGERSPWYPTMRLFRQRQPLDWESIVEEVVASLESS